uniref:Uncharacterized protein n=1 Tax=Oryza punctata TaxID=4537 RepID=A0A0E0KSC9_ORYPU
MLSGRLRTPGRSSDRQQQQCRASGRRQQPRDKERSEGWAGSRRRQGSSKQQMDSKGKGKVLASQGDSICNIFLQVRGEAAALATQSPSLTRCMACRERQNWQIIPS